MTVLSRHEVTVRHMTAGIDNYVQRQERHTQNAKDMQPARNDDGLTVWESPQQLRMVAHEHELADECMRAMFECASIRNNAMKKALAHRFYVLQRLAQLQADTVQQWLSLSLRQVCAIFATVARSTSAPPGQRAALNVLATCHASNAPGLSLVAMTMQVTLRE
jgi:hypothetical protein